MARHTALNLALTLALLLSLLGPPAAPVAGAASGATTATAEAAYTIVDLGTLGGGLNRPYGVNDAGQVVGESSNAQFQTRAYLWEAGQMTDLGTLGSNTSGATDINDAGQVAGHSINAQGRRFAFVWQAGQITNLGALGTNGSLAHGINNAGQIVGESDNAQGKEHAFIWQNGQMTDLGTLGGGEAIALRVNGTGQVVGGAQTARNITHAFLWQAGQMTDLGTLGGEFSIGRDINDAGQVVGEAHDAQGTYYAALWQNGQATNLGDLGTGQGSRATAINNAAQVVGTYTNAQRQAQPFLWQNGQMVDLHGLLPPGSGWTLQDINALSDSGIIVGTGFIGGLLRGFAMFPTAPPIACADPQVPAPLRGLQTRQFGANTVRADSFGGGANWTASGTVWLGGNVVVQEANISLSGGSLTGSGVVSMVTATGPERVTPLLQDGFSVNASGTLTPSVASGFELRLPRLGGFCVKPDRYDLGIDLVHGVLTGSANLLLRVPEQPLVAKPFSFTLRSGGNLSGLLLEPATFDLGLIDLTVTKALLGNDGITTKEASLILNAVLGGASVQVPDGAFRLTAEDGLATTIPVLLPNITFGNPQPGQGVGGFGIEGVRATLNFGGGSYRFAGAGTLLLPGIATTDNCKIGATLELVSTPPPIREASFSVSGGCVKIPIGTTGAFITGFSGKTTANETDLALDFTADVVYGKEVPAVGELLSGTFGAHWDTTWSVGLNGTVKMFKWDVANASLTLGPDDGLRGSVTLKMVPVLEGTAQIHAWEDGAGYHLTGHADTTIKTSAGALIRECTTVGVEICLLVPPVDFTGPSENADFGEFRTPLATSVYGLKGYLNVFGYSPAFFVDVDGNIDYDLGGLVGYQLVDQPGLNLVLAGAVPDAVYTMQVDTSPALIVGLAHDSGDLSLTLIDPNGREITEATVAADLFTSTVDGQTVYSVADPVAGTWTVRVGNRAGDEQYVLRAFGATVTPLITQVPTPTPAANGYEIAFAGTAGPNATYSLFYDDDDADNDGRPIAQGVPLSQGTVAWDTRTVPAGSYYLYAMLDDPAAAPVFAYSAAPVAISDTVAPGVPTNVTASIAGDEATIAWTPPADLDLAGYRIRYTEPGNGKTFVSDLPDPTATSYTQPGLALNGTWAIAVSAYDINGNEGAASAAVPLAVVAFVAAPAPVNVSPAGGPTAGGTAVTIGGIGFQAGATVTIGGVAATGVQVVDAQTITAVAPPHAAGLVAVVVTNPGNLSGTLAAGYEYADPQPGVSPSPAPTFGVTTSGTCQVALAPAGPYAGDTVVTARVSFDAAALAFAGWTLDGVFVGWATTLDFPIGNTNHALAASCAPRPGFGDVSPGDPAYEAITQLAARGYIRGYTNGNYGPDDTVQRAQMAALIARATSFGPGTPPTTLAPPACLVGGSWDCEDWGNGFKDRNGLDANLWRNVGTLQHYGVAFGYDGAACAARKVASPCFGPTEAVSYAQTISFITRAMKAKGYWTDQPGAPQPYAGVPGPHAADVATFHIYTQGLGGVPAPPPNWSAEATRGWFARALQVALESYWGVDRVP